MNDNDLPSDSDESDVDYVPTGKEAEGLSEEDSGPESDGKNSEDETEGDPKKRKKTSKKPRKKKKVDVPVIEEKVAEEPPPQLKEEEKKKKADSLWADFMKDCGAPKPKTSQVSEAVKADVSSSVVEEKENKSEPEPKPGKITVTEIFEFAGEKVSVEKEVDVSSSKAQMPVGAVRGGRGRGRGGGLSSVLSQLGKGGKLSTLEKSKLDWERFKRDQGIKEDLEKHNKGKNGYLEKQDFLERADLRQFEIEKEMRTKARRTLNR